MTTITRTIDEALSKFELTRGTAGDGEKTACETSLLNWVWGEEIWSDALVCAHPLIRLAMIRHNDDASTTEKQRKEAVRLGVEGALDTWWVPTEVVVWNMSAERGADPSRHDRLVSLLTGVATWKINKERADLQGAYLQGADLQGAYLQGARLRGAYLQGAYLQDADLRGADLQGAYLQGARLQGADLQGAKGEPASLPSVGWEFKNGLIVKKPA